MLGPAQIRQPNRYHVDKADMATQLEEERRKIQGLEQALKEKDKELVKVKGMSEHVSPDIYRQLKAWLKALECC